MKKAFQVLGILSLLCFSFFYTEKTVSVVKEHDDIMVELKEKASEYQEAAQDASVVDQTIVPGKKGKEIDFDKSYSKMKRYGKFNKSLVEMKEILPSISISTTFDKFVIGGNPSKNQVTLIFLLTKEADPTKILKFLSQKEIKANFFIDFNWYEKNGIEAIVKDDHEIGNLSLNYDYNDSAFAWLFNKIKKYTKKTYCYDDSFNTDTLMICSEYKTHTIKPNIITETKPLQMIKKQVKNGSIIAMHINSHLEEELSAIIAYLKSKNYEIVSLNTLLQE